MKKHLRQLFNGLISVKVAVLWRKSNKIFWDNITDINVLLCCLGLSLKVQHKTLLLCFFKSLLFKLSDCLVRWQVGSIYILGL